MFVQFLVFPPMARRYGILNCLKVSSLSFPIFYVLTPFTVLLPTSQTQQIAIFTIMLLKCCAAIVAFPCNTILLTNSARSLRLLGTLNGVATSLSAIGRAAGPSIGGTTFTLGINIGYVIIPWWTLAAFSLVGAIPVWWLIEMEGFGDGGEADDIEDVQEDVLSPDDADLESASQPHRDEAGLSPRLSTSSKVTAKGLDGEGPGEDEFPSEESPLLTRMKKKASGSSMFNRGALSTSPKSVATPPKRRVSNPIGMSETVGPGSGGRKLSSGLGYSLSGMRDEGASAH